MNAERKIFLVGLPGCGKSTLGKRIAEHLSIPFFDLDIEIEKDTGHTIEHLFNLHGEDYFRKIEKDKLNELSTKLTSFLMASGGGTPCFYNNMEHMNATGTTIYVNVAIHEIARRLSLSALSTRPLFDNLTSDQLLTKLAFLLNSRKQYYEQSQFTYNEETPFEELISWC